MVGASRDKSSGMGTEDGMSMGYHLLVLGLGYTGCGVAQYFAAKGWKVSGTCRGVSKRSMLQRQMPCVHVETWDALIRESNEKLKCWDGVTHVLSTIPPDRNSGADPVLQYVFDSTMMYTSQMKWIGYIGTTSVYGDHGGQFVTEDSKLLAQGNLRKKVDREWQKLAIDHNYPVHIFRCGGIYGPNRSMLDAVLKKIESATQKARLQKQAVARCHVLDICSVIESSMKIPRPGSVYNIVDDDPASRREVEGFARKLLGQPPAIGMQRMVAAEKIVVNDKIKTELGVALHFPTYREGIEAIYNGDTRPFTVFIPG